MFELSIVRDNQIVTSRYDDCSPLCSPKRAWKAHVYGNLNNSGILQFALLLFVLGDAMVFLK